MLKLLAQIAGVGLVVAGVGMLSVPAGLIVAGLAVAVILEVRG